MLIERQQRMSTSPFVPGQAILRGLPHGEMQVKQLAALLLSPHAWSYLIAESHAAE